MTLPDVLCPFCKSTQKKSIKEWDYVGTKVTRFKCECGKFYNFYKGKKSNWTIPKGKKRDDKKTKT